jgi:hypothetical protein
MPRLPSDYCGATRERGTRGDLPVNRVAEWQQQGAARNEEWTVFPASTEFVGEERPIRPTRPKRRVFSDPVEAGVAAVAGPSASSVRLHSTAIRHIAELTQTVAALTQRVVTLEGRLAARTSTRSQAIERLDTLIARLEEETKDMELPSSEEAWAMLDLSTLGVDEA